MKKIKGLRINRLLPIILAGTISINTGCSRTNGIKNYSIKELLEQEEISKDTLLDELIENDECMFSEKTSYVEAADMLSKYLKIIKIIDKVDFENYNVYKMIDESEYDKVLELSVEEVEELAKKTKTKAKSKEEEAEKQLAYQKLKHLQKHCTKWVHSNGKNISIEIMMESVKSVIAAELGLTTDDYAQISITPRYHCQVDGNIPYTVRVGLDYYKVPINSENIWNTINYIYEVQNATLTDKTEYKTYEKAINYAKTTIISAADIKKDKVYSQKKLSKVQKSFQ